MRFTPKSFAAWIGDKAKRVAAAAKRGQERGAEECVPILRSRTIAARAVASKAFLDGWRATKGILRNTALHAYYVENGRRPGRMPPHRVLVAWVQLRLSLTGAAADRAAWAVARKIAENGIKGRFILKRARPLILATVLRAISHEIAAEMKKR